MTTMLARIKAEQEAQTLETQRLKEARHQDMVQRVALFAPIYAAYREVQHLRVGGHPLHMYARVFQYDGYGPEGLRIDTIQAGPFSVNTLTGQLRVSRGPLGDRAVATVEGVLDLFGQYLVKAGVELPTRADPGVACD